jgi:predicted transcriptional regulator
MEAFSDPLFEKDEPTNHELKELVANNPVIARAVLRLYDTYKQTRENAAMLAEGIARIGEENPAHEPVRSPSEDVNDLLQAHMNHFPALEEAALRLWRGAKLRHEDLLRGLIEHLRRAHHVEVNFVRSVDERGSLRRYDGRTLLLSELLPTRSRSFQLAHQIGLIEASDALDRLSNDPRVGSEEARKLARVALANYFAGAVLMPYDDVLQAAREERYDIDVIGRRFRVSFEQVCHRLTSLRRPGHEGVPFHMMRIDVAGNISKRFSASGIRFARFSGACPRWNVFSAFLTPGMIRIQLSRMPDGIEYFCLARTIQKDSGGWHAQQPVQAIGLGCRMDHARELVYSDGLDIGNAQAYVPVGVTCRVCDRVDCDQRVLPSLKYPLEVNENVRKLSLYAPQTPRGG